MFQELRDSNCEVSAANISTGKKCLIRRSPFLFQRRKRNSISSREERWWTARRGWKSRVSPRGSGRSRRSTSPWSKCASSCSYLRHLHGREREHLFATKGKSANGARIFESTLPPPEGQLFRDSTRGGMNSSAGRDKSWMDLKCEMKFEFRRDITRGGRFPRMKNANVIGISNRAKLERNLN